MYNNKKFGSETIKIIGSTTYGDNFLEYMQAKEKETNEYLQKAGENYKIEYQRIGCGKCIGCRLDYSKQWANRCILEACMWEQNWFITLTYDPEHLPYKDEFKSEDGFTYTDDGTWGGYLEPKDMTDFLKRLRKHWKKYYNAENIRYFYCGEYGGPPRPLWKDKKTGELHYSEGFRPHYHMCTFNFPIPLDKLELDKERSKSGAAQFICKEIEEIWGKGRVRISELNWQTCAYTARYITKKINGEMAKEHYPSKGQTKEFVRMSRMPGIAKDFYDRHKDEIYKLDEIILKVTDSKTISVKPCSYYDRLYDIENHERMQELKEIRKENAVEAQKVINSKTTLTMLKQLNIAEELQIAKAKALKREI